MQNMHIQMDVLSENLLAEIHNAYATIVRKYSRTYNELHNIIIKILYEIMVDTVQYYVLIRNRDYWWHANMEKSTQPKIEKRM